MYVGAEVLTLLALLLNAPATQYSEIVSAHATIKRSGGSPLEVRVTYPKARGSYPLILFSHGFRGSMDSYDPLISYWVRHGYVCIQPNHADSYSYYKGRLVDVFRPSFGNWSQRPGEVSLAITELREIERQVPGLEPRIDAKHIGVGGHSFGAHTSELLGGATTFDGSSYREPRTSATLLISPSGVGGVFTKRSFAGLTGPLLVITGSEDTSITSTTPEQRRQPFDHAPAGDKYLLWTEGAHHNMGGISGRRFPGAGPDDPVLLQTVQETSLAFWDLYLKGDPQAKQVLARKPLDPASHLERR